MTDPSGLLRAYDDQLRTEAETLGAVSVTRWGPLLLATFLSGQGLVTYRDLGGESHSGVRALVAGAVGHFRADGAVTGIEWKTRGHDRAPGLHDALHAHGFVPGDSESVMIGPASALAVDVPLPDGVTLRPVTDEPDVRAMCAMQDEVFGRPVSDSTADAILRRQALDDGTELWVAEADGRIVTAGRLEPVAGTDFAGVWGGACRPEWRDRGIYRALTAARARSALALGKTLINSDSTEYSRPVLERYGLIKVTTTTPYAWRR